MALDSDVVLLLVELDSCQIKLRRKKTWDEAE